MSAARTDIVMIVASDREEVRARATRLADRLGIELIVGAAPRAAGLILVMLDDHLELADAGTRPGKGVMVDWREFLGRGKAGLSKRQPLARAMGRETRTIVDATAGLGRDAAMLAAMGFEVMAVERSPIVFALLEDGLRRAMDDPSMRDGLGGRLRLMHGDARDALERSEPKPDAVLIDPMYPPKKKSSALARKSIRVVREAVGADDDAAELLKVARAIAKRVVVKRADDAPALADGPTASIRGTTVRYDIYSR